MPPKTKRQVQATKAVGAVARSQTRLEGATSASSCPQQSVTTRQSSMAPIAPAKGK